MRTMDNTKPSSVQINGMFFNEALRNSESMWLKSKLLLKIALPKNVEPKPITASRVIKPTNIAPKDNNNNGNIINMGPSCMKLTYGLNTFVLLINVKKN
jgi:hypothetical protein